MPKKEKTIVNPSPIDEPSIGFAKPVGPPVWWYSAFAVIVILFLIVILLSFLRFWLRGNDTSQVDTISSATPKPTNAPYSPNTFLSPLPYENFTITYSRGGAISSDTKKVLTLNDVVLILNQDTVEHKIFIQNKMYLLSPNEVYAHKVSSKELLVIKLEDKTERYKIFTFVIQ